MRRVLAALIIVVFAHAAFGQTSKTKTKQTIFIFHSDEFWLNLLEEIWKPYLDGRGTRDEALAELVKRTGTDKGL